MDFQERIRKGFESVLIEGLDFFFGISSILLRISEQFSQPRGSGGISLTSLLKKPKVLFRLLSGFLRAKIQGRNLLPKDIWKVKGVLCSGADTSIFKDKVSKLWGKKPLETYGATEYGLVATQSWTYEGLTLVPYNNFWEFIPEEEYRKSVADGGPRPNTLLIDELAVGEKYVIVGTNFHGGAMVRYAVGDVIQVIAGEDEKAEIKLPQIVFVNRIDDVIDIGGITRLTEKPIWQAIENSGIEYVDWTVRKEYQEEQGEEKPILHLYIEFKAEGIEIRRAEAEIHESLQSLDESYGELETMTGLAPLRITALSKGTFRRYIEERQAAGADLAHLKPSHMNPPEKIMEKLLKMSDLAI
jgi:phenylacetate-coenzyme A ligase PaaK-like adenylate-forming protein